MFFLEDLDVCRLISFLTILFMHNGYLWTLFTKQNMIDTPSYGYLSSMPIFYISSSITLNVWCVNTIKKTLFINFNLDFYFKIFILKKIFYYIF